MFKQLDRYLTRSFIPPFLLMFGIALFAFVMQFLWLYIDEIMGKGADLLTLSELIAYLSVTFFPMSLPVGVLVAAVMVMGNLAERYELSSFKSAGVSLIRIMWPLMIICTGVAFFSFLCSNTLIPISNLKFQTKFYDLRRQKPVLALEPGVFDDSFNGFTIRIGSKEKDEQTIGDVMIYDNTTGGFGKYSMIYAKTGTMKMTDDKQFMVMHLENGYQIQELNDGGGRRQKEKPQFIRSEFRTWEKVLDLGQFTTGESDEGIFNKNQKTQSSAQLMAAIDTIDIKTEARKRSYYEHTALQFSTKVQVDTRQRNISIRDSLEILESGPIKASLDSARESRDSLRKIAGRMRQTPSSGPMYPGNMMEERGENYMSFQGRKGSTVLQLNRLKDFDTLSVSARKTIFEKAKQQAKSLTQSGTNMTASMISLTKTRDSYLYELNQKISLAFACLIFLFVGAPMGAIVRKGGFGWPLLIAIVFFAIFIVLSLMGKSFVKSGALGPIMSGWLSVIVFIPIGAILTYGALNDYTLDNLIDFFKPITRPIAQKLAPILKRMQPFFAKMRSKLPWFPKKVS
jgi:lipopolysaccharide export system permease protein